MYDKMKHILWKCECVNICIMFNLAPKAFEKARSTRNCVYSYYMRRN